MIKHLTTQKEGSKVDKLTPDDDANLDASNSQCHLMEELQASWISRFTKSKLHLIPEKLHSPGIASKWLL